jgi:hypothetical protein
MADNLPGICLIGSYFQRSGIYVFVIAFACVYYLINAPLLLSHWDLGWHLAAGDLIRDQGHIPVQDPWSFTSGGRQLFNLSWLWDFVAFELRYGGGVCPVESRLLSWLFLFLGLYQFRYMSFFFIFSTVPLALHLDRLLPKRPNNFQIQRSSLAAGIILACALPLIFNVTLPMFKRDRCLCSR